MMNGTSDIITQNSPLRGGGGGYRFLSACSTRREKSGESDFSTLDFRLRTSSGLRRMRIPRAKLALCGVCSASTNPNTQTPKHSNPFYRLSTTD